MIECNIMIFLNAIYMYIYTYTHNLAVLKLVPCWFEVGRPFVTLDQQRTNYVRLLAVDILTI